VIFLGQSSLHHALNRLASSEARFVVWGAQLPDQAYPSIGSDNVLGGRRATCTWRGWAAGASSSWATRKRRRSRSGCAAMPESARAVRHQPE
jgi:hypothetical protein